MFGRKKKEEVKLSSIHGKVLGFHENKFTKPLESVPVFLKILVKDRVFNTLDKTDIKMLEALHPEIFESVKNHRADFHVKKSAQDGSFIFTDLPAGNWSYIVCAFADTRLHDNTAPLGNDGNGNNRPISGKSMIKNNRTVGVVVPIADTWHMESIAVPKHDDPVVEPKRDFMDGVEK